MKRVINLYKPIGMTPLEALHRFKELYPAYRGKKMSYPGRLDPLAEGVLILLVGDENKKMRHYMKLDKEYIADILFGISSDSHDILGIAVRGEKVEIDERTLKKRMKQLKGSYTQKIPFYSSVRVKGKPLFYYARQGKTETISIPEFRVKIHDIQIEHSYFIPPEKLLKDIIKKIDLVQGDFRQEEIKEQWKNILTSCPEKFFVMNVRISCSSGTYIRAIADDVGKEYGGGILIGLKRTHVGKFEIKESVRLK